MPKIKEVVTVHIPVEIEYEKRKGAREAMIDDLMAGQLGNCFGYGTFGGFSRKVLPPERVVEFGKRYV